MIKFLPITALFIAVGVVAAPVLMSDQTQPEAQQIAASTADDTTRRGTRTPLNGLADASWEGCGEPTAAPADQSSKASEQPRRGGRSEFILASNDTAFLGLDGPRRGTR
jgi:hypothetical protein